MILKISNEVIESHKNWLQSEGKVGKRLKLKNHDLRGSDLSGLIKGANLINADLRGTNFYQVNFMGVNLKLADLSRSNLIRACFLGANLEEANLCDASCLDADLSGANLNGADLTNVDFRRSKFVGADLNEADLTNANLSGTILIKVKNADRAIWNNTKIVDDNRNTIFDIDTIKTIPNEITEKYQDNILIADYYKGNTPYDKKITGLNNILGKGPIVKDKGELNIFISYARENIKEAKQIYEALTKKGHNVWLDIEKLIPGQNWKLEIRSEIENSNLFVPILSNDSVNKQGFFQKELKKGFEILETLPEGDIYMVPIKIDDCKSPKMIDHIHYAEMFNGDGVNNIVELIEKCIENKT